MRFAPRRVSSVEAGELLVDPPLDVRVEWALSSRRGRTHTSPRSHEHPDGNSAAGEGYEREQPGQEPEPALGRRGHDARPELRDERVRDLALGVPRSDALADEELHPLGHRRVRLVERRLAHRTHELRLEVGGVRWIGGRRAGGDGERAQHRPCERARAGHDSSAPSTARRSRARASSLSTAPTRTSTTFPSRSITNVSGKPVTPYVETVSPG